jgi:hypothetical protein
MAGALFITTVVGVFILGARYIILDSLSKAYCICDHEYNEHYVVPRGMINLMETEKCKVCGCRAYRKNDRDSRNSR